MWNIKAVQMYTYVPTLLSLEDAWCDSEITIMRLGEVERMCIQSRVGGNRTAGRRNNRRGKERKRISVEYQKEGEKENEGVIKYPTTDVKSDRKMHQVLCS